MIKGFRPAAQFLLGTMQAALVALLCLLSTATCFLHGRPASVHNRLRMSPRTPTMMASKPVSVGIVGATGAVGEEILSVMEKRNFAVTSLKLFASEKSAGKTVASSKYGTLTMEPFTFEVASKLDVVLLAVGGDFSLEWAEKLAAAGVLVIDNSSAFRYNDNVPLVIPEINIAAAKGKKLIANPNCTTAIALMALWPIHKKYKIKRAIISTYQAASGAGAPGMQELKDGMATVVAGGTAVNKVFDHPLPYNIIPHIDVFQDNLYTKEEMKVTAFDRRKRGKALPVSPPVTPRPLPLVCAVVAGHVGVAQDHGRPGPQAVVHGGAHPHLAGAQRGHHARDGTKNQRRGRAGNAAVSARGQGRRYVILCF